MKTTANQPSATIATSNTNLSFAGIARQAKRMILSAQPLTKLADIASDLIDEQVTPADVLRIINLFLAICFAVFPVEMPIALRLVAIAWMAKATCSIAALKKFED